MINAQSAPGLTGRLVPPVIKSKLKISLWSWRPGFVIHSGSRKKPS